MLLFSLVTVALLCSKTAEGQSREQLLKAGFVEKFTHFVEWPEGSGEREAQFNISVIGDNKLTAALSQIFRQVNISGKKVQVEEGTIEDDFNNSEIVVISKNVGIADFEKIINKTLGKPTLTISERSGYGSRGSIINLIVVNELIKFEINRSALESSGLKMSSLLIKSGILIDSNL